MWHDCEGLPSIFSSRPRDLNQAWRTKGISQHAIGKICMCTVELSPHSSAYSPRTRCKTSVLRRSLHRIHTRTRSKSKSSPSNNLKMQMNACWVWVTELDEEKSSILSSEYALEGTLGSTGANWIDLCHRLLGPDVHLVSDCVLVDPTNLKDQRSHVVKTHSLLLVSERQWRIFQSLCSATLLNDNIDSVNAALDWFVASLWVAAFGQQWTDVSVVRANWNETSENPRRAISCKQCSKETYSCSWSFVSLLPLLLRC